MSGFSSLQPGGRLSSQAKFIRFQQRRSNLDGAFTFLRKTLASTADVEIRNAATIKAFEMTFELCWKALKDLLEYQGTSALGPRETLKQAFKSGLIQNGQGWIDL